MRGKGTEIRRADRYHFESCWRWPAIEI